MITTREATTRDDLVVGLHHLKAFLAEQRSTPELYLADWDEVDEFRMGFLVGTHRLFFVEASGEVVACGWLLGEKLDEGYVLPAHRGHGYQRHLITARVEAGGRYTEVRKTNHASNSNFEKMGWQLADHERENYQRWKLPASPSA